MHTKKERDKQNKKKKYNLVINKWRSQISEWPSVDFSQCEAVINPCYPVSMDHCNLESYYTWYHSLCRWHCHILLCLPNSWDKVGFKSTWLLFFLILETHFVILNFVFFFFFSFTSRSEQHQVLSIQNCHETTAGPEGSETWVQDCDLRISFIFTKLSLC